MDEQEAGIMKRSSIVILAALCLAGAARGGPAERAYRKGDWEEARRLYEEQIRRNPEDARTRYNLGNALYRAQSLDSAEQAYAAALKGNDPELRARAAHNLGNARMLSGNLPGAIEAYENALRADPTMADAKYNLELALKLRESQPPQQQDQKPKNEQQNQQQNQQPGEQGEQGKQQQQQQPQQQQDQPADRPEAEGENPKDEEQPQQQQGAQAAPPQEYTEDEAKRILDGLAQEEREILADRLRSQARESRPEKDW
jgi:tetratricopeptide (TPR) repeat protein